MHQSESILRTSICSDDKGNIYVANSNKKVVSMLKESEDDVEVVHTPGVVHCMAWCSTTNRLWVMHYNDDGTRVMASRHYLESAQMVASPAPGGAWNGGFDPTGFRATLLSGLYGWKQADSSRKGPH